MYKYIILGILFPLSYEISHIRASLPAVHTTISTSLIEIRYEEAISLYDNNQFADAENILMSLVEATSSGEHKNLHGSILYALGMTLIAKAENDTPSSRKYMAQAAEEGLCNAQVYAGMDALKCGEHVEATYFLDKAAQNGDIPSCLQLAKLYRKEGYFVEAKRLLTVVISSNDTHGVRPNAQGILGNILFQEGKEDQAMKLLEDASQTISSIDIAFEDCADPEEIFLTLAALYEQKGNYQQAEQMYKKLDDMYDSIAKLYGASSHIGEQYGTKIAELNAKRVECEKKQKLARNEQHIYAVESAGTYFWNDKQNPRHALFYVTKARDSRKSTEIREYLKRYELSGEQQLAASESPYAAYRLGMIKLKKGLLQEAEASFEAAASQDVDEAVIQLIHLYKDRKNSKSIRTLYERHFVPDRKLKQSRAHKNTIIQLLKDWLKELPENTALSVEDREIHGCLGCGYIKMSMLSSRKTPRKKKDAR